MPLTWPKPFPLVLFAAVPLFLMWAPARALLGAAVSRLPVSKPRLLSSSQSLRRRRSGDGIPAAKGVSRSSSSEGGERIGGAAGKVIVIAGPTATGKSSVALALCKDLGGEIVSCDSVQVYRDVFIGCNKPSAEEMRDVRHHLVDVAALDETFTAGQFVDRAHAAIDDILSRGRVPVVVGGTMMYLQWLVHGKPDAPKKDPAVAQAVATELLPFHDRGDWDGALKLLAAVNATRAASMARNDWYRLSRSLEVLRVPNAPGEVFTGLRTPVGEKYDYRSFFIIGDRERLFRRIDRRCEDMLIRGLLKETADLLVRGVLDPASPAGRAIGYRQAIDFLFQEARLAEPTSARGDITVSSGLATCGGNGNGEGAADPETRFVEFLLAFTAKTRQYAGEQMKWFRSSKGGDFSWEAWDLGGPIEEVRRAGGSGSGGKNARGGVPRGAVRPSSRAGDGCGLRGVATSIAEKFELSREAFDNDLGGEYQASLREENRRRAADMKRYVTELSLVCGGEDQKENLRSLVGETKELVTRIRQAQPERFREGADMAEVQGWHAGTR